MPARSHNARATALALAIGANGLVLALLLTSHDRATPQRQDITAMIWIDPVAVQPPPSPPPVARLPERRRSPAGPTSMPPAAPLAVVPSQLPQDTSIDVPRIDWHDGSATVVQEYLRREQEQAARKRLLDSGPEVLVLPRDRGPEKGHVEHFEGGVTMHFDGDCVVTTDPLAMQPWALDPVGRFFGGSASARAFSKGGGCRADQDSRKRAAALEKAVKPRYLGGTRPLPEEDQSPSAIKIP